MMKILKNEMMKTLKITRLITKG